MRARNWVTRNWVKWGSAVLIAPLALAPQVHGLRPLSDQDVPTPTGWHREQKGGASILTPDALGEGEVFRLSVESAVPLKGVPFARWFATEVARFEKSEGKLLMDRPTRDMNGILTRVRAFEDKDGHRFVAFYIAIPTTDGRARLARGVTSPQPYVYEKYLPGVRQFTVELARQSGATPPQPGNTLVALAEGL